MACLLVKFIVFLLAIKHYQTVYASQVGVVHTVAGGGEAHQGSKIECNEQPIMDGIKDKARFNYPWGIVYDPIENTLYVADCGCPDTKHSNDRIRKVSIASGKVITVAGSEKGYRDGVGKEAMFHHSAGMAIDIEGRKLYIADSGNDRIRLIDLRTNYVTTYIGNGRTELRDGTGTAASIWNPQSLEINPESTRLYVADTDNHAIRVINLRTAVISTLAGGTKGLQDGIGREAKFYHPTGMCLDPDNEILYIADHYNHVIRKLNLQTMEVITFAGNGRRGMKDGVGQQAQFYYPEGMTFDTDHQVIYVVEFDNHAVRMITLEGKVSTIAGGSQGYKDEIGSQARFFHPTGLTYDHDNKLIYITDQYNHRIRSVTAVGFQQYKGFITIGEIERSQKIIISLCFIILILLFVLICPVCKKYFAKTKHTRLHNI